MAAANYVQTELGKREAERELRDREFWSVMFGGEARERSEDFTELSEEEAMLRSPLAQR